MKLHTDFHDYYDTAIGYGVEENVHYSRFTREVEVNLKPKLDFPRLSYDASPLLLGFCGEIYPVIELLKRDSKYQVIDRFYAYDYGELIGKRAEWNETNCRYHYSDKRQETANRQFFADWRQRDDRLFLENKTPVWTNQLRSGNRDAVVNPPLKTYEFRRVKNATTAFQEISVYLSNILVERKEVASVEDKYRIELHGFDLKLSFRKEKRK